MEELRTYIIERVRALQNKHDYDYGFTSREEIIYGLKEIEKLSKRFDIDLGPASCNIPDWIKSRYV